MTYSRIIAPLLLWGCALLPVFAQAGDQKAASTQAAVPKGEVLHFTFDHSKIFPGTTRDVWVYVPAQYSPDKPACLYVNQDGIQFNAPAVFDQLIANKEMPVTIGVFVMHGRVKAADPNAALDRFNRSYEYDGLGDGYARFILDELLPEVEAKKTSDGRAIRISKDGNDHAIAGTSSGAIAAFTAAWERPDAFRRVFSGIGTYVGLRGGDRYPTLLRKTEPKPLRVFLQDGSSDQNIYAGDWWMANQMMERSLVFAGYEVQHVWGEGGHNNDQATAVFPDAMRFLWKDWPQPIPAGRSKNGMLNDILVAGEGWQPIAEGRKATGGLASNAKGEVFFGAAGEIDRIGADGAVSRFASASSTGEGLAVGADGKLYAMSGTEGKLLAYDADGRMKAVASGIRGNGLAAAHNGNLYAVEPGKAGADSSRVWLIRPGGKKTAVEPGMASGSGVTLSPDQTLLYVAEGNSHWIDSYQIQADGSLQAKQRYYWLHSPDDVDDSGAEGMAVDRDGRLYVATRMGIQVCDQAGRVNAILPLPGGRVESVCFGGANFDTLYVRCGDQIYKRKLAIKGANGWDAPNKPGAPHL